MLGVLGGPTRMLRSGLCGVEADSREVFVLFLSPCRVLGTGVLMTSLTVLLRGPDVPGGPIPIGSFNALKKRLLQSVRLRACMAACVFCLVQGRCCCESGCGRS